MIEVNNLKSKSNNCATVPLTLVGSRFFCTVFSPNLSWIRQAKMMCRNTTNRLLLNWKQLSILGCALSYLNPFFKKNVTGVAKQ